MKILLVPWALLLFGVSLNSGHYIRNAEDDNSTYKVHDDSSGITFVNPKPEKPTLREILYYHFIERPRESRDEPASTERSFTNSHGNQFLDLSQLLEESYDDKDREDNDDGSYLQADDEQQEEFGDQDAEKKEEAELTTTQKPLTDQDVKEAYKSRSYLFDQMRQRYSVKRMAVPDSLNRRKRQANLEPLPAAPSLASDIASKDAYIQPKTYGINLNSDGGYVWNNLNKPPTYYELGPSNGSPDEGSYASSQSQENMPPPSENAYIPPVPDSSDSSSSEDIYVVTNRPSAQPLENEAAANSEPVNENPEIPESINENPEPINDPEPTESGANYPVEPIIGDDSKNESTEFAKPEVPEVYENPEPNIPVENPGPSAPQESEIPQEEVPVNEGPVGEPNETPGNGYGQQPEQSESESESSEGDKIKEMPEAPTLPPLNYDILPDYIRDAISSTEKPASYEQTDNPYTNPQPNPEDKQVMQDKMEDIFATVKPVEDIPKTYGMNLTSNGGHVWNDMVNPPVSYDIGSPSQPEQEHKEEQPAPATEQPEIREPENPLPAPAEPEKEEPIANPEEPNQEPEEAKPIEEPSQPEHESEEPIANPAPASQENEDNKPIEEPVEPVEPETAEEPELVESEPAAEPEKEEPIANLEEPNQEPEEAIPQQTSEPEQESEEPIANPEPSSQENEDIKPIEELAEPVEPEIAEEPEPAAGPENPEPGNEEMEPIEEPAEATPEDESENPELVAEPGNEEKEEPSEEPAEVKPEEESKKPDIMSELLKSEQFWKWLGAWTATYMELLEKHIRKIAIQEICNREKSGEQMCLLEDKPQDTGVVIKDGKIIVDGKEMDMTHTDNLDKDLKRGHQNNKGDNDKKNKNENKIEASTIYGNSVGNEKVTNVFIFTADKADDVIDKIKPANSSDIDFVIDDRVKEENEDEKNKEKSSEVETDLESNADSATEKESNASEPSNEETQESEADKTEVNSQETSEADGNKDEADNEETSESDANEESPITEEANKNEGEPKEEINNEETIKEEPTKDDAGKDELSNEEVNKNESNEDGAKTEESDKDSDKKESSSGDIKDSELEEIDESKSEPSES